MANGAAADIRKLHDLFDEVKSLLPTRFREDAWYLLGVCDATLYLFPIFQMHFHTKVERRGL
jgi:hypothetical protein